MTLIFYSVLIVDHDGLLELKEFFRGCSALFLSKKDRKTKLEYIFGLYDTNNGNFLFKTKSETSFSLNKTFFNDGFLSFKEVRDGFKAIFLMLGSEGNIDMLSKNMAEQTMRKMNSLSMDDEIKKSKFTGNIMYSDLKIDLFLTFKMIS